MNVLVMRPNPKPDVGRTIKSGQCPVIQPNSRRPQSRFDFLELQRGMRRIEFPKREILVGKRSKPFWKLLITFPEPCACVAVHGSGRVLPWRYSSSASLMNRSSLPAAASSSICLSQSSASYSASHLATWRTSTGFSLAISASISSTLLMTQEYDKYSPVSSCIAVIASIHK